jgi:hypothetical protein
VPKRLKNLICVRSMLRNSAAKFNLLRNLSSL